MRAADRSTGPVTLFPGPFQSPREHPARPSLVDVNCGIFTKLKRLMKIIEGTHDIAPFQSSPATSGKCGGVHPYSIILRSSSRATRATDVVSASSSASLFRQDSAAIAGESLQPQD